MASTAELASLRAFAAALSAMACIWAACLRTAVALAYSCLAWVAFWDNWWILISLWSFRWAPKICLTRSWASSRCAATAFSWALSAANRWLSTAIAWFSWASLMAAIWAACCSARAACCCSCGVWIFTASGRSASRSSSVTGPAASLDAVAFGSRCVAAAAGGVAVVVGGVPTVAFGAATVAAGAAGAVLLTFDCSVLGAVAAADRVAAGAVALVSPVTQTGAPSSWVLGHWATKDPMLNLPASPSMNARQVLQSPTRGAQDPPMGAAENASQPQRPSRIQSARAA
mmetsp:Transcript_27150/g.60085  ORF Transcript_27150/g.60085 Transcript_27150/m.60085 type:complete len:286 (+) Transcript_27150:520-1377(+)